MDRFRPDEVCAPRQALRNRSERCRVCVGRTAAAAPCRLGRRAATDLRAVLDAIFYLLRTGCQWRLLPKCFPPKSTVFGYFRRWWQDGTLLGLYYGLLVLARQAAGREPQPTAGIVDSQSVKTTESGGPRGYDAGKKINGRKRHVLVDTLGLLLRGIVHLADVQDRDGLAALLTPHPPPLPVPRPGVRRRRLPGRDRGRHRPRRAAALTIVKRSDRAAGFVVLPDAGSSSAASPGSAATGVWPRTPRH